MKNICLDFYEDSLENESGERYPVFIKYCLDGSYYPGDLENPPEYPEFEIVSVKDSNGKDIELIENEEEYLEGRIWENYRNNIRLQEEDIGIERYYDGDF
jgi:hypothetical protein